MKILALTLALVAFLGLMAYTNPTMNAYDTYLRRNYMEKIQKENPDTFDRLFGSLMSNFASGLIVSQTIRKDFVFFSTYEARFDGEQLKIIGLLNNFIVLESPGYD